MELYLMQHGLSLSKELDPEQPLSPVGRDQVQKAARAARLMGLNFDLMVTSPKKRAQQTAALLAEAVDYPTGGIRVTDAVKAMTPWASTLAYLEEMQQRFELQRVCIVGHMPSIGEIVSAIITSGCKAAVQIENAGICRLDILDFQRPAGSLIWYMGPQQLGLVGA